MNTGGQKRPQMPRTTCLVLIGIGYAVACISIAINARYGQSRTIDVDGYWLQGALLLMLSLGPATLMSLCGSLLRSRRWVLSCVVFTLAIPLVALSVWNAQDFMSDQMLGKAMIGERRQIVNKDIAEMTNAEILRSRKDAEAVLGRAYAATKDPTEKKRLEDKLEALRAMPLVLTAPPIETAVDPRGKWFSRMTGWDREAIQGVTPAAMPILMAMVELFFPLLGFGVWPTREPPRENRPPRDGKQLSFPENERKLSKAEAREDVIQRMASGSGINSNRMASDCWGVTESCASKWLSDFRREGLIKRQRQGRFMAVQAVPLINGNGRAMAS